MKDKCGRATPRTLVITGPGKGKTTAALGVILRSLSYGKSVLLARFAKARHSGELTVLAPMRGIEILSSSRGMTPSPEHPDYGQHVQAAQDLFGHMREKASGFDLIVADEICGMTSRNIIPAAAVVAFIHSLRPDQGVVLTGRGASAELLAVADTVSEILNIKHPYASGVQAEEGIEF